MTTLELLLCILSAGFVLLILLPSALSRFVATGVSLLGLLVGLYAAYTFDKSLPGFQEVSVYEVLPAYNLTLALGVDGLSILFLLLTLFVFPVCFLAAWSASKLFLIYVFVMELLLVLTFSTLDLFFFFVFFESLLIPMFLLIGMWGARDRKIKAAYYFFLYTLFGSLFMLLGILYLYEIVGTTNYEVLLATPLTPLQQGITWCCFFLAFAVKMPLFPLHIWLPEAHVEAPTVGSMLLASLLLKLGGYGFIRFSIALLPTASAYFSPLVSTCALMGVLYASLVTLRQVDMKRVIAYSSVAHMNLVVLGLFSGTQQGIEGAVYLMLGHGVVSTALFFCVGVLYDRYHSRMLRYYAGLATVMPLFITAFFLFTLANMSFPGTPNFLGELLIFLGIFEQNMPVLLLSTAGIVLAAVYSIWLFNRIAFGTLQRKFISDFSDLTYREAAIFLFLLAPMVFFGLYGGYLLDFLHLPIKELLQGVSKAECCASPLMTLILTLLPLVNFMLLLVFPAYTITCSTMGLTLLFLLGNVNTMVEGDLLYTTLDSWMTSALFEVQWALSLDALTYTMFVVVYTVSTLVHLYSLEYMSEDPHLQRFMSYLSLFTFFMFLLITSDNLITLFLGWEGVGLCSYLLITFWYVRVAANKAAIKAMIVNRMADLALTLGILATFYAFRSVEFSVMFGLAPYTHFSAVCAINLLLFIGAMGKSAQIGLHTWLPDAMEGPTPVSALIHAATMVTAGVFLIIRCSPLFEMTPPVLTIISFVGAATAFMAATSGLMQNDLKKIIAYSTCSQLGYMVFICGLSGYSISFFHLTNHAFFKALLFLSAGAVIHAMSGEQDLRRLGGLLRILPYTYIMFIIGSLALMGFPFLTGFYSKDLILEIAASSYTLSGTFAYWLGLVTAFFTAFYSFRLLYLAFYSAARSPRPYLLHVHELTPAMGFALAVLSIGSIFFGYMARDLFIGLGTTFWNGVIATSPLAQLSGEFLPVFIKLAPFFGSILAVLAVFYMNFTYEHILSREMHRFLSHKWYFDTVYNLFVNQPLLQAAYHTIFQPVDKGALEATALRRYATRLGHRIHREQTGRVYEYAWRMLYILGVVLAVEDAMALMASQAPLYMIRNTRLSFLEHRFYRVGEYALSHVMLWFRKETMQLTGKVFLLFMLPPTLLGILGIIYYWYHVPAFSWIFGEVGGFRAVRYAVYSSCGYLFYWFISITMMIVLVALFEFARGRSYFVAALSYVLSSSYLVLFYWNTLNVCAAYCYNLHMKSVEAGWKEVQQYYLVVRRAYHDLVEEGPGIFTEQEIEDLTQTLWPAPQFTQITERHHYLTVHSDYEQVIGPLLHYNMIVFLLPLYLVCLYAPIRALTWEITPEVTARYFIAVAWAYLFYSLIPRFDTLYTLLFSFYPDLLLSRYTFGLHFTMQYGRWQRGYKQMLRRESTIQEAARILAERRANVWWRKLWFAVPIGGGDPSTVLFLFVAWLLVSFFLHKEKYTRTFIVLQTSVFWISVAGLLKSEAFKTLYTEVALWIAFQYWKAAGMPRSYEPSFNWFEKLRIAAPEAFVAFCKKVGESIEFLPVPLQRLIGMLVEIVTTLWEILSLAIDIFVYFLHELPLELQALFFLSMIFLIISMPMKKK